MKRIFKYPLKIVDEQTIEMPDGAKILYLGNQQRHLSLGIADLGYEDAVCIWALVDDQNPVVSKRIRIYGTGHEITDQETMDYLGTVICSNGEFVWHVFVEK